MKEEEKGGNAMYEKPELIALGSAAEIVQSLMKAGPHVDTLNEPTISTYETEE